MRPLIQPWTAEDEERLKALVRRAHQSCGLLLHYGVEVVVREHAKKLGCPFPPLRTARKKWADSPNNEWRG
jgi:hypothetical protein